MADVPRRRFALAGRFEPGTFGSIQAPGPGVFFTLRRPASMLLLSVADGSVRRAGKGARQRAAGSTAIEREAPGGERVRLLWTGPGQWLAVAERLASAALEEVLSDWYARQAHPVVDVSHARVVIGVSGTDAEAVLAHACALDLAALEGGACAPTLVHGVAALLHFVGATAGVDVYIPRSYAVSLWEWLNHVAAGYGYEVIVPRAGHDA